MWLTPTTIFSITDMIVTIIQYRTAYKRAEIHTRRASLRLMLETNRDVEKVSYPSRITQVTNKLKSSKNHCYVIMEMPQYISKKKKLLQK